MLAIAGLRLDMASMVTKACSSTSSQTSAQMVQEKASRNKRKFRADPPLANPNEIMPLQPNKSTSFEFSAEKLERIPNHLHRNRCNICGVNRDSSNALKLDLGLSCASMSPELGVDQSRDETETSPNDYHDADWSELTESQLEELVLSNLGAIYKSAIKKIIVCGYSEDVATNAILRSGLCYGCKDTVSNIVDNTLALLRGGQETDRSREHYFDDLEQMKKYVLAELVCLLREVRPFFSTGDAMWCLLICDMNVSHACAVNSYPSSSCQNAAVFNRDSSFSWQYPSKLEFKSSDLQTPFRQIFCAADAHICPYERTNLDYVCRGPLSASKNLANEPILKRETSFVPNGLVPEKESRSCSSLHNDVSEKENQNSISNLNEKPFNATRIYHGTVAGEKIMGCRKASGMTRKEYKLRHKSIHFEKHHHRSHGSKITLSSGKHASLGSNFGGQELDKRLKAVADSTGVNAKNPSFKIGSLPQYYKNHNISSTDGLASVPLGLGINNLPSLSKCSDSTSLQIVPENKSISLPVADTELSLSLPVKSIVNPTPISYNTPYYSYGGVLNVKSLGKCIPLDRKDEMIMKLVPKVQKLQNQLQEWTEWANQKVMQAAHRLTKDKAELKTLRQDVEEMEYLKKEKQVLEENAMKKLSEMENALFKACRQVEQANAAARRLVVENAVFRREMEAEKVHAAESAESCQEVLKREKKTLLEFQSVEKQKSILQEELAAEKHKMMLVQQELQQAKDVRGQIEAKWHQEKKEKCKLLAQASSFRKEREYTEASAKAKEEAMKSKADTNLQKCKDDIDRLEKEISQLKVKLDSSKIAALRRGIDGTYASKLTDSQNTLACKESAVSYVPRVIAASYFEDFTGNGNVKRERECVMCLSEEMSVVFLPCAHQVVCMTCNELHEKQGMKDCPSCRSQIQQRVCVRYAHP
ncbi:putative E3 ubiquitin-protein ligase RF298 [Henckelia pumila]|uniref:putative E3 ubiquitin-protein ligase RF298 n=1 Tax=Henckelia pumila TaxID=405737 RepID=UPI003C6DF8D5